MNAGNSEPHQGAGESSPQSDRRPRKRRCNGQIEGAADGPKYPASRLAKSTFECPFSKLSPHRFPECRGHRLSRATDVMQHIKRQHDVLAPPVRAEGAIAYCARCRDRFCGMGAASRLRAHSALGNQCQVAGIEETGVTIPRELQDLQSAFDQCTRDKKGDIEKWYAIWDTLFRGKDRPLSPHVDITVPRREVQSIFQNAVVSVNKGLPQEILQSIVTLSLDKIYKAPLEHRSRPSMPPQALPNSVQIAPIPSRATHLPSVSTIGSPVLQAQVPGFDYSLGLLNPGVDDARTNASHAIHLDHTFTNISAPSPVSGSEAHANSGNDFPFPEYWTAPGSENPQAAYVGDLDDSFVSASQDDGFSNTYGNEMGRHSSQYSS